MPSVTIELLPQSEQVALNLRRWAELVADPELAKVEGRIETDRHGHIIMSPPPAPGHGNFQSEIAYLIRSLLPHGRTLTECPISTADGVKAADVAWASQESWSQLGNRACFPQSPEICVEVVSPGNTEAEMKEKMALYFDAGAREVWFCDIFGAMSFFAQRQGGPLDGSQICPQFPREIRLC